MCQLQCKAVSNLALYNGHLVICIKCAKRVAARSVKKAESYDTCTIYSETYLRIAELKQKGPGFFPYTCVCCDMTFP